MQKIKTIFLFLLTLAALLSVILPTNKKENLANAATIEQRIMNAKLDSTKITLNVLKQIMF